MSSSCTIDHPPTNECDDQECIDCGLRDCPHGCELHYHHDGCPSCYYCTGCDDCREENSEME